MKDLLQYLSEYCRCDSLMLILLLKSTLMKTVYVIGNCIKRKLLLYKQVLREINYLKQPVVARVSRRDSQRGCSWNSQTLLSGKHICREYTNEVNSCLVQLVYSSLATWCIFLACLLDFPLANSLEREWVSSPWLAFSFRNSNQLKL